MTILILADHDNQQLFPSTRAAVNAATQIGGEVHMLVAGDNCKAVTEAACKLAGVNKVLHADAALYKDGLAEHLAALVASMAKSYSHVLAPSGSTTKDCLPRAAALCDVSMLSDVIAVISADTFKRPIYAGNAIETVQMKDAVKFMTIRATGFDKVAESGSAAIEAVNVTIADAQLSRFVSREQTKSERPELTAARVVISGGRGLGSKENFALIERIADKLKAAIGASRAAVDAGYVPNDYQVGQTGKVVAPELYMAVGISGAIQHLAGMKDSKVIVAINKDENAPIFELADYGLVGDLFEILPQLEAKL